MKYLLAISIVLLTSTVFAQKIYTRNDTIAITQDSITIKAASHRGDIQWQKSLDNKNWINLEGNKRDSIKVASIHEAIYRVQIKEGTCLPIYSDTLKVSYQEIRNKITENIEALFPDNIISSIKEEMEENKDESDYGEYLTELHDAAKSLSDSVKKYSSSIEFENAITKFQSEIENPILKNSNNLECNVLNAGLGYAKGASINAGVGAGAAYIIYLGLKAQQGGGAEVVYDFVNQTRQVYIYKMCSLNGQFGAGIGGGFQGYLGFSGYTKWLMNIPFYQQNSMNRFAGSSKSEKFGISPKVEFILGINPSLSIGTSRGVYGDCDNVINIAQCPVYFNNQTPKPNSVTSVVFTVGGAVSAGASASLVLAFSKESSVSCSSGIDESYLDFKNGSKSRKLAALKMAKEIITSSPISGLSVTYSSFDLIAAAAAITYATIDVENCPSKTFPTVTTNDVINITQTTAFCGGKIITEGGSAVSDFGVCWNTTGNPTPDDRHTFNLTVSNSFTANLTELSANATYYIRAYAKNIIGTSYGEEYSFKTNNSITQPIVTTNAIDAITQTTATSGGNITSDGGAIVTARGVCWNTTENPTVANSKTIDSSGTGNFNSSLSSLTANTTYYVRAYATNSAGTSYGNQVSFSTSQNNTKPTLTTNPITSITQTTATSGGNITYNGGSAITASGVCWSTSQDQTTATNFTTDGNTSSYTSNLTGLTANTTYYVWAYAINSAGTGYGNEVTFTTSSEGNLTGSFTDSRDGHVYKTVTIGDQVWMAENLAYLPSVSPPSSGSNTTPYYYVYGYDGNDVATAKQQPNYTTYGVLYNWSAAKAACPSGWHLSSIAEWTVLENYLIANGYNYDSTTAGNKIAKSMAGTTNWNASSITGAIGNNLSLNNKSGFAALPAGDRGGSGAFDDSGAFGHVGNEGNWWSSLEDRSDAFGRCMRSNDIDVGCGFSGYEDYGYSVRCIKD